MRLSAIIIILHVLYRDLTVRTTLPYQNLKILCYFVIIFALKYTCIHENVGYKRVQTGGNGCGWVHVGALGRRGHGGHEKQVIGGILGSRRSGFGCYGRGNFPGHHVLVCVGKNGVDGCRWVQSVLDGCK